MTSNMLVRVSMSITACICVCDRPTVLRYNREFSGAVDLEDSDIALQGSSPHSLCRYRKLGVYQFLFLVPVHALDPVLVSSRMLEIYKIMTKGL